MKRLAICLVLASAALASPALATSSRCAQFEILGNQGDEKYDPFSAQDLRKNFQVKVTRLDDSATSVQFLLVDGTPEQGGARVGTFGPATYDIEWTQDNSRQVFVAGPQVITALNGARVEFGRGRNAVATTGFQLYVPRGQVAAAGTQSEQLIVRYQCFGGKDRIGGENEQLTGQMEIALRVPRFVAAYIGGTNQRRGEIDFGTISATSSNLSKAISVTALSTVPYQVSFGTDNGGKLKRNAREADGIDYRMRYAGVDVNPGDRLTCPVTPAPLGKIDEFAVTLDRSAIARLPAGDYADVVTLTFEPRDGGMTTRCGV